MTSDNVKLTTISAVVISIAMALTCLSVVTQMRNDIDELYEEFMFDIKEFNLMTDDAWTSMMDMAREMEHLKNNPEGKKLVPIASASKPFGSIFGGSLRASRAAELPSFCACASAPNTNCPAGPPGPSGVDGAPGASGIPGPAGAPGLSGTQIGELIYAEECIKCPPGAVGEPGSPGRAGAPGLRGVDGSPGEPKQQGPKGPTGLSGDEGEGGPDGIPGERGSPGEPGVLGKPGPAGPPGSNGEMGEPGAEGERGTNGTDGKPGDVGEAGPPGFPGLPGPHGTPGTSGAVGFPGQDAQYCPCPHRAAIVEVARREAEVEKAEKAKSARARFLAS